jgi:heterodisulfide reductase subunit C2
MADLFAEIPDLKKCFQCGTCVSSCPAKIYSGHFSPREFILHCMRNMEQKILNDDLWRCITCHSCNERCPQEVNPYDIIVKLKNIALRENLVSREKADDLRKAFDSLFETGLAYPLNDVTMKRREELGLAPLSPKKIEVRK